MKKRTTHQREAQGLILDKLCSVCFGVKHFPVFGTIENLGQRKTFFTIKKHKIQKPQKRYKMFYASKHKASVKHVPWLPIPTEHNNNNKKREEKKLSSQL